ncbi:Beta-lactamase [Streptomyces globisporus]|uniref:Beta-lactamase n=1 Tax=Streptomyces globisporus TaxID=1908 RepID=A0ABN8UUV7_STRGL|nr:Beta-lactamase [Streptomyces globisporus]
MLPDGRAAVAGVVEPYHRAVRLAARWYGDLVAAPLGGVLSVRPGSRGLTPHLAALSSVADAPRRLPPPPYDARHQTPLPDPA